MSPRYFLYIIFALFVSGVHKSPSTTSAWATLPTTTTNQTAISSTPTATSPFTTSTSSMSTGFPERLANSSCPPGSLSTSDSGSGLSSVSVMCGFEADSSIYGIGNRLGIYLQWLETLITYRYIRYEAVSVGAANFIFQLSNFVRLLYISSKINGNGGGTYAVECWIVLLICTGAIFPGLILSPAPKAPSFDPNPVRITTMSEVIQTALSAATQLYGVWFVFKGMDEMFAPVNSRSAFAFAKVNLYHRFRLFLQIFFVISAMLTLIQTWIVIQRVLMGPHDRRTTLSSYLVDQMIRGREGTDPYDLDRTVASINITVGSALVTWIIIFILSIELIIPWNHISGAYSFDSGQWIPLVTACSLVRLLYVWQQLERLPRDDPRRMQELRNSLVESQREVRR